MKGRHLFLLGLSIMMALLVTPGALWAFEIHPLVADSGACTGTPSGLVFMQTLGTSGKSLVLWRITGAAPNEERQLFWICQSGTACHAGCGYMHVGSITTNASGKALKVGVITDPFPGASLHWNICIGNEGGCTGNNLWSGIFNLPPTP